MQEIVSGWGQQPQEAVEVNLSHPLAGVLICAYIPGIGEVAGRQATLGGTSLSVSQDGQTIVTNGSSDFVHIDLPLQTLSECALFAITTPTSVSADACVFSLGRTVDSNPTIPLRAGNATPSRLQLWSRGNNGATIGGARDTAAVAFVAGQRVAVGLSIKANGGPVFGYINGQKDTNSTSSTANAFTVNRFSIGTTYAAANFNFGAYASSVFLCFSRALSDSEHADLAERPWALLQRRESVPFPASSSGPSTGTSSATASATAQGLSLRLATGTAAGTSAPIGQGSALAVATASASATASAAAQGQAAALAAGSAAGIGSATGQGRAIALAVGSATAAATASATALSAAPTGTAAGAATATGQGAARVTAAGTSTGTATAAATGSALAQAQGTAAGTAVVAGAVPGSVIISATGVAAGASSSAAAGRALVMVLGSASGLAVVSGAGLSMARALGSAYGAATVSGALPAPPVQPEVEADRFDYLRALQVPNGDPRIAAIAQRMAYVRGTSRRRR